MSQHQTNKRLNTLLEHLHHIGADVGTPDFVAATSVAIMEHLACMPRHERQTYRYMIVAILDVLDHAPPPVDVSEALKKQTQTQTRKGNAR